MSERCCRLDRSIVVLLPNPNDTPSRKDQISAKTEQLHRIHGSSVIWDACRLLGLSIAPTASTIFHRYLHRVSLKDRDVWSAAVASTVLGAKVEDVTLSMREVFVAFNHVYRRRFLYFGGGQEELHPPAISWSKAINLVHGEKVKLLKTIEPLSQSGPVWKEWKEAFMSAESSILRELGFTLHWIPKSHSHRYLSSFINDLGLPDEYHDIAWKYCNDSYLLDLCVRYPASWIAMSSIALATRTRSTRWSPLIPGLNDEILAEICNSILGLSNDGAAHAATLGYLPSLRSDSSFTDPTEYLWYCLEGRLDRNGTSSPSRLA